MEKASIRQKLISNTFYVFLEWSVVSGLNFLSWIVAGKLLLSKEYGIATTIINFLTIVSNITLLGLTNALSKLIPEYQAKKRKKEIYGIINFSLRLSLLTNILASVLILLCAQLLASHVFKSEEMLKPLYLSAFILPFMSLFSICASIVYGFQYMKLRFISSFISTLAKCAVSIVLIMLNFTYFGILFGFFTSVLVGILILFRKVPRKDKTVIDKSELFSYAIPGLIGTLCWLAINNTGNLILSSMASLEAAGIFTLTFVLTSPITLIPQTLTTSSFPLLSQLYGRNEKKRIENLLAELFRYSLLIALPFTLVLVVFPKQIILILGNPSYLPGYRLLQILSVASLILGMGRFFLLGLYAVGRPKLFRNIQVLQALLFLTISSLLVRSYSFMAIGYTFLLIALFTFSVSFFYMKKFYRIHVPTKSLMKISVASLLLVSFLYFSKRYVEGILMVIVSTSASLVIYITSLLLMKFFTKGDVEYLDELKEWAPQLDPIITFIERLLKPFL